MMTGSTLAAALLTGEHLLAAGNPGGIGRQADRADTGEALIWLAFAGGVVALVCLGVWLVLWSRHRLCQNSPGNLFRGLCRTHGLNRRTRRLLSQVARHHRLRQPARLFTEPNWLNPANLPAASRHRAAEVDALRNRLFA